MKNTHEHNARENKQMNLLLAKIAKHFGHEKKHLRGFLKMVSRLDANPLCEKHLKVRSEQLNNGVFGLREGAEGYDWDYNAVKS